MIGAAGGEVLTIEDLHVTVEGHEILRGVDLVVREGELHALMGPNGSGKSTLANAIAGNPAYQVASGRILLRGEEITTWTADVRARAGVFLAFQYPEEISGVPVSQFLRQAVSARRGADISVLEVRVALMEWMQRLDMDPAFASRYLNEGFSGGEKKRNEILQMAMLEPDVAVLDETDSGLDVDALRIVARGIEEVRRVRPALGILVVTHYRRILEQLQPDRVHVMLAGRIVENGGPEFAERLDREGTRGCKRDLDCRFRPARVRRTSQGIPFAPTRVTRQAARVSRLGVVLPAPPRVLDAMDHYYETTRANVHRGVYAIAEEATRQFEMARRAVGRFIKAPRPDVEIVFTKNATEALNLVAHSYGRHVLPKGKAILLTELEHHANIVPWLMLAAERAVEIRYLPSARTTGSTCAISTGSWTASAWSASRACRTCSALSTTSVSSLRRRTRQVPLSSPTPPSSFLTVASTWAHWESTSWPSRATRCSGRRVSASYGGARTCWTRCHRS